MKALLLRFIQMQKYKNQKWEKGLTIEELILAAVNVCTLIYRTPNYFYMEKT